MPQRIFCCHGKQLPNKHTQDIHNDGALKGEFSGKAQKTLDLYYIILSSKLCRGGPMLNNDILGMYVYSATDSHKFYLLVSWYFS